MGIERFAPHATDRILVVAPHPDDDVLACGGTLALAADAGAAIRVIYLTDGGASHPASRLVSRDELRDVRELEALAGLRALGIAPDAASFVRGRDGELGPLDRDVRERLTAEVERFAPSAIFAPFARDPHPDHRSAAALVAGALAATPSRPRRFAYAVWQEHRGTARDRWSDADGTAVAVDTARELARKRRAIAAHRSQFGRVVRDDPNGFRLPHALIASCCRDQEQFLVIRDEALEAAAAS